MRWLQAISEFGSNDQRWPQFAAYGSAACSGLRRSSRRGLDLSRWELAFTGAEPVRASTLEQFADAFLQHAAFGEKPFLPPAMVWRKLRCSWRGARS